ncbi:excalibur calcium-binding domain-containing protein [Arthrobacter sp. ISL-72]|uniref:excalibur calcium-binding domain-containing protein n=1 Tax=Arthrobacter sp. ISL-72 TaxID=2819114 RepID=UPI001BE8330B|nr:excalibur calcium-binding domain-containing protein [Arthrobacter sp. ISL-72]MBT2596201.1 excalibur calcium-binding domain-containing protein [Arthrobacter sp. ISL-72]
MKKTLALVVLTGLMLTGCGGKQPEAQPTGTATAVAAVADSVTVPGVMSLTLEKATDQLEDLGFKVEAVDTVDGKTIIMKKNWQVTSQDAAEGAQVAKGSTVHLGVKSLEKVAAEKAAADKAAADKAAAEAAAAAAAKAAADKAAADQAAADKVAADAAAAKLASEQAAAQQAAQQAAVQQAPAAPVAPAPVPAAAYYANCAAAKAAGAAPLYAGQAGYSTSLDRDRDGVACEN